MSPITVARQDDLVTVTGNAYPKRFWLRSSGFVWNKDSKHWQQKETPGLYERVLAALATEGATDRILADDGLPDEEAKPRAVAQAPTDSKSHASDLERAIRLIAESAVPRASGVDAASVREILGPIVSDLEAKIAARPAQRLEIVTASGTRVIDGHQHKLLPDLIRCLSARVNVWLAGPSGSGKTHAAEQAAQALGVTFRLLGAMTMSHDLVGYCDAQGRYVSTAFVDTFRNGGLILLDELDAASGDAVLTLNAALSNCVMGLPGGEILRQHPDFYCVAGANTWGLGATADYNNRNRLDGAILQRFPVKLEWGYDEVMESAITPDAQWVKRVQRARANALRHGLKVLITPRHSIAGAALIAAGYTPQQAAGMTYLAGLSVDQCKLVEA